MYLYLRNKNSLSKQTISLLYFSFKIILEITFQFEKYKITVITPNYKNVCDHAQLAEYIHFTVKILLIRNAIIHVARACRNLVQCGKGRGKLTTSDIFVLEIIPNFYSNSVLSVQFPF